MRTLGWLAGMLLVIVVITPGQGHADEAPAPEAAVEHYQAGLQHYNVQEYEAAIAEFKEAYKLDPRREFLFNLAQAERLSHHCKLAIVAYETFLRDQVADDFAVLARTHIERCRAEVEADERAAAIRARSDVLNVDLAARAKSPPTPVYKKKWFWGVMAGSVVLAASAITVGVVLGTRDNAQQLPPVDFTKH